MVLPAQRWSNQRHHETALKNFMSADGRTGHGHGGPPDERDGRLGSVPRPPWYHARQ
jgi:hypothetical protein